MATLYYVIGPSSGWSTPSVAEVKAGQLAGGGAATASGSTTAPTTTGTFDWPTLASGLSASTAYKIAFVWSDGATDVGPEVSPSAFTTTGGGAFEIDAAAGSYGATGAAADLLAGRALEAAAGSYAATGAAADLLAGRALDAEAGAYALTGANAELGIAGLYLLDAEAGSYATTGADADLEPPARAVERSSGGGGGKRPRRPIVVRIDDEEFIVETPAEAQQLIAQAERLAETAAKAKAEELAARTTVRMRAARRAAPVVRIEAPEPVAEVEAIRERVIETNARIQSMYVDALRTALIAREIQRRMDEDEEDALAALML